MHFLVTGHTGFKGSWLTLLLRARGHRVSGLSLDPVPSGLFQRAEVARELEVDLRSDIRDPSAVADALGATDPDVVIHMAAQPLVRESLSRPRLTFETNVLGTLNVLEQVQRSTSVKAQLIVTTDKVYRDTEKRAGYNEDDPLGGSDPYSASKAMAEILTAAWSTSFPTCPTATARAGNVIGGGDVSADRLLPDLFRAWGEGRPARIRYPRAVRPWQHVLDALNGYLTLVDALISGSVSQRSWNLGPDDSSLLSVGEVVSRAADLWGEEARWSQDDTRHPPETGLLSLNAGMARDVLGWHPRLDLGETLRWTVNWERDVTSGNPASEVTRRQVQAFERLD